MKIKKNITHYFIFQWSIVFLISAVARLPYFSGMHCYFDGDEAIIGIMAQDLLHGENIPVYFYGQQYGFSFFEVIAVALGIIFFGSGLWALKFGALLIFSIGTSFIFRLLLRKGMRFEWALLTILIVTLFPTWIVWACKARGGYVTAYSLACILLFITQTKKPTAKWLIITAGLMALLIHSQIFIACSIFFLLITWIISAKKWFPILLSIAGFFAFYFIFRLPAFINDPYWLPGISFRLHPDRIIPLISELPRVMMGHFYYEMTFPMKTSTICFGMLYFLLMGVFIMVGFLKGSRASRLSIGLIFVGSGLSFLLMTMMNIPSYRYFLGGALGLLFMMVLTFLTMLERRINWKGSLVLLIPFAVAIGSGSRQIKDSWMEPEKNDRVLYQGLLKELDHLGLQNVFCTDPLLQWMLNYSGYNARYTSRTERVNRFMDGVNTCYKMVGCKTAIVGYKGMCLGMDQQEGWHNKVIYVNDKFFIFPDPTSNYLKKGGFEFQN